jgi:hypothetical protein
MNARGNCSIAGDMQRSPHTDANININTLEYSSAVCGNKPLVVAVGYYIYISTYWHCQGEELWVGLMMMMSDDNDGRCSPSSFSHPSPPPPPPMERKKVRRRKSPQLSE